MIFDKILILFMHFYFIICIMYLIWFKLQFFWYTIFWYYSRILIFSSTLFRWFTKLQFSLHADIYLCFSSARSWPVIINLCTNCCNHSHAWPRTAHNLSDGPIKKIKVFQSILFVPSLRWDILGVICNYSTDFPLEGRGTNGSDQLVITGLRGQW